MNREFKSGASVPPAGLKRILIMAICICAELACAPLLHAQSAIGTSAPVTAPADASPAVGASSPAPTVAGTEPAGRDSAGSGSANSSFGLPRAQSPAAPRTANPNPTGDIRSLLDPFEPGVGFGNFSGSRGAGMGFNGAGAGMGRQRGASFGQFTGEGAGGRYDNPGSLFQMGNIVDRAFANGANGAFGTLPRFDQMMRSSFTLPLASSVGTFKLSYRDMFGPSGNAMGGNIGRGSASAMFGTSNLGNGMFLSAGTGYGSRTMASGPGNSSMTGNAGGQRHSGPSVALKLSF